MKVGRTMLKIYGLNNLHCANCAAKIEKKIASLPEVEAASIAFTTKKLYLTAADPDSLLVDVQKICTSIEEAVQVTQLDLETRTYRIENLSCAHCATKIERKLKEIAGITDATIVFATKQLIITANDQVRLMPQVRQACATIDSKVKILELNTDTEIVLQQERSNDLREILWGAGLFLIGQFVPGLSSGLTLALFIVAYFILGRRIIFTALKNIRNGQIFDENFLMSVATLGAFAIREYPEAVGIMLFFRVGEYFEQRAVNKSRNQIMAAVDLRPDVVQKVADDGIEVIPANQAAVGDIVLVRPGDRIPLDGVVVSGESRVDTSPITGEPVPVHVVEGKAVISGCVNIAGVLKVKVSKVLAESMVTRILQSVENAAASKPRIDRFITRFARIYTPVVVLVAVLIAIVPPIVTGEWGYWLYTALTFLVISCPCALVLSVPLAFFSGIGAGSKQGILFKGGIALEALKNIRAVVMDKTGTITKGNFVVQRMLAINTDELTLLRLCASCELHSTHPIGISIIEAANERKLTLVNPIEISELAGRGIVAKVDEGEIICGNINLLKEYNVVIPQLPPTNYGTQVLVALNGKFIGRIEIADTIKDDAGSAIAVLKQRGIKTIMLSGDTEGSAIEIAKQIGIDEVRAQLLPEEKLTALLELRDKYGSVLFVGDGINDAPVLAGADVGAAMGSGADAALEAADIVFMGSKMASVPQALSIAEHTAIVAKQNIVIALLVKFIVVAMGLLGHASMWLAVFADTGVAMLCVLNSVRILYRK